MRLRRRTTAAMIAMCMLAVGCGSSDGTETGSSGPTSESDAGSTAAGHPVANEATGVFRYATSTSPQSMDPTIGGGDPELVYFLPVYDRLVGLTPEGELEPGLATDWALSDDGLTFTMQLREGVTFHDGAELDADAVVANIEYAAREDSRFAGVLSLVDSVEATGDLEVQFNLNQPGGDMADILAGYPGMMASPAVIEAGTLGQKPVGSGPFTVESVTDVGALYDRWPDHWEADAVTIGGLEITSIPDDSARLNATISGEVDMTFIRPNQAAEAEAAGLDLTSGLRTFIYGLTVNASRETLSDPSMRQALSNAIDRQSIDKSVFDDSCEPAVQPYPPGYWAHDPSLDEAPYTFDPEAARAAIAEAGAQGAAFTIAAPSITAYQRQGEIYQSFFEEVGLDVELVIEEAAEIYGRLRTGDYDILVMPLYSAQPSPVARAGQNYRVGSDGFVTPAVGDLLTDARSTADRGAQAEALHGVTQAVLDAGTNRIAVCIPETTFAHSDKVNGVEVAMLGNYDFRHWTISE